MARALMKRMLDSPPVPHDQLTISEMSPKRKTKTPSRKDAVAQLQRFKEMTRILETDESPDALDRAFGRLDMRKKEIPKTSEAQSEDFEWMTFALINEQRSCG
jgi:hypothetical protein